MTMADYRDITIGYFTMTHSDQSQQRNNKNEALIKKQGST